MNLSETVLQYVQTKYVLPARTHGRTIVEVKAGDIHNALHWSRRVPLVCSALSSRKFQISAGVKLIGTKDAPPSGLSTRTIFRYEILDRDASSAPVIASQPKRGLLASYGVAAHLYRQAGGGDAFLLAERENFGSVAPQIDNEGAQGQASGSMNP